MRKSILVACLLLLSLTSIGKEAKWTSHFAYNNVTQIAVAPDRVYAISDGSLYSVEKQSEKIQTYDRQSGLHGTGIACISYDPTSEILMIAYSNGQIDILSTHGVQYVGGLYEKDMVQQKTIYNVTFHDRTAYFATHFGIQTFDLRENKLVDSYWLRPNGQETPISDIRIIGDSIYAFGGNYSKNTKIVQNDSLFSAALTDNIVDYRFWKREKNTGRITQDTEKGKHYADEMNEWYSDGANGIKRITATDTLYYKPEGPLVNIPYRICASQGRVFVLQGGREATQYKRDGIVMIYDEGHWTNITTDSIRPYSQKKVYDFMNAAADPRDKNHFFVTSYGTGLYEFQGTRCIKHTIAADDNPITAAATSNPSEYTRLDAAVYDSDNNLWFINAGGEHLTNILICIDSAGVWHGLPVYFEGEHVAPHTPSTVLIDRTNKNYKWFGTMRYNTCVILLDDAGTPFDNSDDRVMLRTQWTDQKGQEFLPENIFTMQQDEQGRLWLGTKKGPAYIDSETDFFTSDAIVIPDVLDENGENPMLTQEINGICFDKDGKIWIGTKTLGVYVLNSDATEIVAHYTTENSIMPSDLILSLACTEQGIIFIGTGNGLVSYEPGSTPEGVTNVDDTNQDKLDPGTMQRWRLHYAYNNPQTIVPTPNRIYAKADGALFYLDKSSDQMEYLSKETGLNGNTITDIAYDEQTHRLIIAYLDGRIDLLDDDGNVTQMPDLFMKSYAISTSINSVAVGKKNSYLAMPFGIIAINTKKAIVSDTYYIGDDAASVDVLKVIEGKDSIYAFSQDRMYAAALTDNLVDYHFWHKQNLPSGKLTHAVLYRDELYILQDSILYRHRNNTWQQVLSQPLRWIRESDGKLLLSLSYANIALLDENDQAITISTRYVANDAVYSQGNYWLAEQDFGLVRLGTSGDSYFHPEGPNTNTGYAMTAAHGHIYIANGGRWAVQDLNYAKINIFEGLNWRRIQYGTIVNRSGHDARDVVSIAVDPYDPGHFFAATYGTSVYEFKNYTDTIIHYNEYNSTLRSVHGTSPTYYTRTDGAMMDAERNLWVLNATEIGQPLHIRTSNGKWVGIPLKSGGQTITLTTPTGIWVDRRNSNRKWLMDQRYSQGVILFDDGGTPTYTGDDRCIKRATFTDQNGRLLSPATFHSFAQDHKNRIWIGTPNGIIIIPANVDFFTSDKCQRIIIPRNDGTGLGDYLLGDEQINCMAVDGGNRMWIGTQTSGLYLIEDDTITVAHFTQYNSLLPSNTILSIAIHPQTGEVFVGTENGIASYRSDASEPAEDFSQAYAFPNPVRPDYGGVISIAGLMDETTVNIVDAGGNLVCKTRSHGGIAVWDGNLPDGHRAKSGVYTALCNEPNGKHAVVKILLIR
ncbi:MAG: hypothetical protein IJS82_02200 [Paludibacteraceae bacterium]|nr:hypothetical protein [Paludibacteraceae bacterium]